MNTQPYYTEQEVLELLRSTVQRLGSQRTLAREAGVSQAFVCDVVNGRRAPTGALLRYLGFRSETAYLPNLRGPEQD